MYQIKQSPEDFIVNEITNIDLKEKGEYGIFLLKKINYTTEKAIHSIANKLKLPRKAFGYAGNKDKKAITTQYISIKNPLIKQLTLKDISIELKGYSNNPIFLGDLVGNSFEIKVTTDQTPKSITKIVNYFGEQRFSMNNHEVGKAIIKRDFKKAVELIMQNGGEDASILRDAIKENQNNFVGALRKLPLKILKLYIHAYQSYLWNELANIKSREELK